jgi:hypothetical protein
MNKSDVKTVSAGFLESEIFSVYFDKIQEIIIESII